MTPDVVVCGAGLSVTIKRTAHELRCALPLGHNGQHCTMQDSEWAATPPRSARP